MKNVIYLIICGVLSGVIGGMGMGGGTLLIPILTIFLQFEQKNAQAINLLVFVPMAIFALVVHIKNKLVDFRVGIPIILTGLFFSAGGALLANNLSNAFLRKIFGGFLLAVGVYQAIQTIVSIKNTKNRDKGGGFKFKIFFR